MGTKRLYALSAVSRSVDAAELICSRDDPRGKEQETREDGEEREVKNLTVASLGIVRDHAEFAYAQGRYPSPVRYGERSGCSKESLESDLDVIELGVSPIRVQDDGDAGLPGGSAVARQGTNVRAAPQGGEHHTR